jgi:phospholipid N-methyltransferase
MTTIVWDLLKPWSEVSVKQASAALVFVKNFLKHPRRTGSILPSSPFLAKHLLSQIDWQRSHTIVEYGPGTGNITREILKRMPMSTRLVSIESNHEFVRMLRHTIDDPRLTVRRGSAAQVNEILQDLGHDRADYIVSSLPLTTMSSNVRSEILAASARALHPDGTFVTYQYSPAVASDLEPLFGQIERGFTLLNIPPALVYHCSR